MDEKTILIVDDELVWLRLLARVFRHCGYTVVQASSCAGGLEALRNNKVDCALLDFNLGDGSGDTICAAIRERDCGVKTPVILFTSDPGAEDYLVGPHRADMVVFKDTPLLKLPGLVESLLYDPMRRGPLAGNVL